MKNDKEKEKSLKGKKILIFQQRGWSLNIGHFLAKKLQNEGCILGALTYKRTTHEYIVNQKEIPYEIIISNDEIMGDPEKYLAGDKFSLEEICSELGIDSIWPMVNSLRNHVKSYREKYYYSFKQNVSDEEIVDYVMAVYKCIKYFFENFKPDFIISPNFVALSHIMFSLYAKKHGVKMMAITDTKIKGICIFSYGHKDDNGPFYDRIEALNTGNIASNNIAKAKEYIKNIKKQVEETPDLKEVNRKKTFYQKIRHLGAPFYHILKWYTGKNINYLKSIGITLDWKPPRIILRDHYLMDRYIKFSDNYNYYPFEKIKKFVYFPLQFQPEASIDVAAPFFSNQIETARLVAMSLPGDYTLVVKEHPAMIGFRSPSYTKRIDRTPNVKLIDYRISSETVLKKTDLVICSNGTTLADAAFLPKPAIQLGDLGTTLKLPNVFKHTDMTTLSQKIKEVLKINLNTTDYDKKLESYVSAAFDTGFDLDYIKMWEKNDTKNNEQLWQAFKKEIESSVQ